MGWPFFASSVLYGMAFGLLAHDMGVTAVEAVVMSLLVFSGSAQIAVLQAWASGPSALAVFVSVMVANLRYVLMGATLRSWLAPLGGAKASLALLPLVDSSYAIALRARRNGDNDAGILIASGFASYAGWAAGTALGAGAGQLFANPKAIALDFVIVAFCGASAAMMAQGLKDHLPVLVAAAAVVLCERLAPGPWTIVVASLAAALTAALRYQQPAPSEPS